jgi:heme A synthase
MYAWCVLAFNIGVVLWGAYVRATGAGAGCGNHWPLCNGEVAPRPQSVEMLIEFTHRVTSGIALLAIAGLVIWAFGAFPRGALARTAAALSGAFIITEALVGAALVLLQLVAHDQSAARAWWISLHLTNTFLLLGVLALTAWWATTGEVRHPIRMNWLLASALGGLILLGISGAIAALGDTLFPASSVAAGVRQEFSSSAHLFIRLRVFHPFIAVGAIALLLFAIVRSLREKKNPTAQRLATGIGMLAFAQLMLGAINVAMLAPVGMQLVHLLFADLLWISVVLFAADTALPPVRATAAAQWKNALIASNSVRNSSSSG